MKIKTLLPIVISASIFFGACKTETKKEVLQQSNEEAVTETETSVSKLDIQPISHGTMILTWNAMTMYIDPVGGAEVFSSYATPDLILVTDIHGDHLNIETLTAIIDEKTTIIAPKAVADKFPESVLLKTQVLNNGETYDFRYIQIEAIPMYNLREEALKYHEKGRGNGYVLQLGDQRIYISGDTEDIPEMRALQNIDIAFVCMNLPYTMTPESAADAVLEFAPHTVYPYHYRGTEGLSDVVLFKNLVSNKNPDIKVEQLNWYAKK